MEAQMKKGVPIQVDYRVRYRDGGWRWMRSRGSPRFDTDGNIVCWYGSVEDIDDLKLAEKALRTIEARLQPASFRATLISARPS